MIGARAAGAEDAAERRESRIVEVRRHGDAEHHPDREIGRPDGGVRDERPGPSAPISEPTVITTWPPKRSIERPT